MKFRVSSALKNIIGRDLITDDFIAIFELVKNAYDADAQKVTISFEDDNITIADNGKGMSKKDIENKWLFVAYSAKKDGSEDFRDKAQQRKHYAGAKGIGRFSCDRLGNKLRMITKTAKCTTANIINVDWGHFDKDAKQEFIDIEITHSNSNSKQFRHGTILEISHLPVDERWNKGKITRLRRSLEKLVNPFEVISEEREFSIEIKCPYGDLCGPVKNQVFQKLNLKTTQIICNINRNVITTQLIDRGTPLYTIEEPNTKFPKLENVKINLFNLSPSAKSNFTRLMGIEPVNFGSIFLFKNGFRVAPFGEAGDDSLKLDKRKGQGYARYLGTRELIGDIQIWSDNDNDFKEVTSRDGGLVQTEAYGQLVKAFFKTVRLFEKYVTDITWVLEKKQTETDDLRYINTDKGKTKIIEMLSRLTKSKGLKLIEFNKKFLDIINKKLEEQKTEILDKLRGLADKQGDKQFANKIADIQKSIIQLAKEKQKAELNAAKADEAVEAAEAKAEKAEKAEKAAQEKVQEVEKEKKELEEFNYFQNKQINTLTNITNKDVNTLVSYLHHIGIYSSAVEKNLGYLNKILATSAEAKEVLSDIIYDIRKISVLSRLGQKTNIEFDNDQNYDIISYITQYINEVLKGVISEPRNIKIHNKCSSCFKIIGNPTDISILIDNLLHNSSKADAQNVIIELENINDNKLCIRYSDDGDGLNKSIKNKDKILELGFTTTNGSGMGLAHISNIIKNYNGQIIIPEQPSKGFLIEFILGG